ncbi:MAG: dolichyl-phosphate-mannose--protein mannosyltransferase [Prevotella sp.]|nr:dolichyl-phosphate-mannose--protein mannosyltransferase [Bacteroides sp.]MCM1366466.1 dolichyl-phosphate-mannose--protein mannosyltransferase [Prevotella sp.]MCM1437054.1 dolichyl-phosphate-mannose--protein mannosyltransferase [Prevotella sp.]
MKVDVKELICRYWIYIVAFIAMLPALILRDFTPDNELRYVSIAGEALDNLTFFTFTNHGEIYADKPPMYMWICMLGRYLFGTRCLWFVALFSVIPAFVITEVMGKWSEEVLPERWRNVAKLMLLSSVLYLGLALTMRMDMLMAMFIVLSLREFYRMYSEGGAYRYRWLFPIYLFLGLFTKGPYGLLIPLLSSVVFLQFAHRIKDIGKYWGWRTWTVLIGLCLIWFGAVFCEGGYPYIENLLVKQTVGRAVKSFAHDEPFYFYCISIWYSIAPWSLCVIGLIVGAFFRRHFYGSVKELEKFYLTVTGVTFVMLSLVSSKLAVYLLPTFPFIIYSGAFLLPQYKDSRWVKLSIAFPAVIFMLLPAAIPFALQKSPEFVTFWTVVALIILAFGGVVTIIFIYRKGDGLSRGIITLAFTILLFLFFAGMSLPILNSGIGYRDLAEKCLRYSTNKEDKIYTYKVRRPENLDVYLNKGIEIISQPEDGAPVFPEQGVLLIRTKDLPEDMIPVAQSGKYSVVKLGNEN